MSSNCPQCSQPIDQDFGVATCPKCGAVLFVDMDGQVQLTKNEFAETSPEPIAEPVSAPPIEQSFEDNWILEEKPAAAIPVGPPTSIQDADFSQIESEEIQSDLGQAPIELGYDSNQGQTDPSDYSQPVEMNSSETYSESIDSPGSMDGELSSANTETAENEDSFELIDENIQEEAPPEATAGFTDVAEFANSDQAYGPLSYSVIIENIDTKETRAQLQDALSDSKFQWDAKALMKEIKMGKLKLEGINPVKVSVLVERLQDLPVKVSWTQHAYS